VLGHGDRAHYDSRAMKDYLPSPFADRGNMAIFRTRASAEAFVAQDPFVLEGLVKSVVIREWHDTMLT
jgi:hypothetical protein